MDIPNILDYLFTTYGRVQSEEVTEIDKDIIQALWNTTDPLVLFTHPLENLQKLSNKAGICFTNKQILKKVLTKIRTTQDFESALKKWENLRPVLKAWKQFKTHFHNAQMLF